MGFGHRVYKNYDPRAKIIKKACDDVLAKLHISDPLLDIAKHLEEAALRDSYFVERKLYPNVDFYSGIIMRAIGIPVEMFTVMFAIGRMPGLDRQLQGGHGSPDAHLSAAPDLYRAHAQPLQPDQRAEMTGRKAWSRWSVSALTVIFHAHTKCREA